MAVATAKRINHFLGIPVTLVTDSESLPEQQSYTFDNVIIADADKTNKRDWGLWYNKGRYRAYALSPYDETIKLDEILENKDKQLEQRGYVQTISSIDAKSILWIGDNIDHLKKVAEVKKIDDIILNAAIDTVNEATEERLKKANK